MALPLIAAAVLASTVLQAQDSWLTEWQQLQELRRTRQALEAQVPVPNPRTPVNPYAVAADRLRDEAQRADLARIDADIRARAEALMQATLLPPGPPPTLYAVPTGPLPAPPVGGTGWNDLDALYVGRIRVERFAKACSAGDCVPADAVQRVEYWRLRAALCGDPQHKDLAAGAAICVITVLPSPEPPRTP